MADEPMDPEKLKQSDLEPAAPRTAQVLDMTVDALPEPLRRMFDPSAAQGPTPEQLEQWEREREAAERNQLLTQFAFGILQTMLTRDALKEIASERFSTDPKLNPINTTVAKAFDVAEVFLRERKKRLLVVP